eukprot:evm.model.scf_401.3 EVM.evm.TU.scf_401.3   scf_401:17179-23105(+)
MDSSADHNKNEYRRYQYSTAESDRRTGARGGENELRAKEKENDEVSSEARQLKHSVLSKERFIVHKEKQAEELKEKLLKSLSDASAKSKEIDDLRTAKRKLEGEKSTLNRQLGKLKEQLSVLSSKDSNINAVKVAELESETKSLRKELQTASTEVKTCTNIIRTKDKELEKAKCQVEDAARAVVRSKELQNQVADLQRQRDTARHEIKTLQQVERQKEAEISKLTAENAEMTRQRQIAKDELSDARASLKVQEKHKEDMLQEISLLRDQLARTEIVASRVVVAEVKAGAKDEGTIPVVHHIEEVRYLQGEIQRLKEKLAHAERTQS